MKIKYEWVTEQMYDPGWAGDVADVQHWDALAEALADFSEYFLQPARIALVRFEVDEIAGELGRDYAYVWSSWGGWIGDPAYDNDPGRIITKAKRAEIKAARAAVISE